MAQTKWSADILSDSERAARTLLKGILPEESERVAPADGQDVRAQRCHLGCALVQPLLS